VWDGKYWDIKFKGGQYLYCGKETSCPLFLLMIWKMSGIEPKRDLLLNEDVEYFSVAKDRTAAGY
jgi:hypothetical protein